MWQGTIEATVVHWGSLGVNFWFTCCDKANMEDEKFIQPFNFTNMSSSVLEEIDKAYRHKDVYVRFVPNKSYKLFSSLNRMTEWLRRLVSCPIGPASLTFSLLYPLTLCLGLELLVVCLKSWKKYNSRYATPKSHKPQIQPMPTTTNHNRTTTPNHTNTNHKPHQTNNIKQ